MRQQITTKMWNAVWRIRKDEPTLFFALQHHRKNRTALTGALRQVLADPSMQINVTIAAARILAIADAKLPATILMKRFFKETEREQSFTTATIIQILRPVSVVPKLIKALRDPNVYRREAAAYALNFGRRGRRADEALIEVLTDTSQPPTVRGQAAESLCGTRRAIPALLSVLSDPAVEVRFWAVWALGGQRHRETHPEIVAALERMLSDDAVYPGWWSVAREALAMLGEPVGRNPPRTTYSNQLEAERRRIINDPNASEEDRRWVGPPEPPSE